MCRLNGNAVAFLKLMLPVIANLDNASAELVTHNGWGFCYVVGNALVLAALDGSLVGAHTKRVGNNLNANAVGIDIGKIDFLKS